MTKITMQKGVPPTTPDVDAKVKAAEEVADAADTAQAAAQDAHGAAKPTEASKDAGAWAGRATGDPGANDAVSGGGTPYTQRDGSQEDRT